MGDLQLVDDQVYAVLEGTHADEGIWQLTLAVKGNVWCGDNWQLEPWEDAENFSVEVLDVPDPWDPCGDSVDPVKFQRLVGPADIQLAFTGWERTHAWYPTEGEFYAPVRRCV